MVEAAHVVAHQDAAQAEHVTELLHASAPPVHAAAHAAAVIAPAVAMPSAEQLAAVAAAHGTAQPQTSVAGTSSQHNEVVGKVLADSLHGGGQHGPSIDALVNSLPGHGAAHDGLQAVASHAAGAFGGAHLMLSQEMMVHPDNVAPAHG
jgi:hypothetical protein